jgi:hypothetical protein
MSKNVIVVICGNCRTFVDCIDSMYENIITKLFNSNSHNILLYLYLKLHKDVGRKELSSNHTYNAILEEEVLKKINEINQYKNFNVTVDYKLLFNNEIEDSDLLSQVKDRTKYIGQHYGNDHVFLRGLHCHYNFECCGKYILEKEEELNINFNHIVYIRTDLYFTEMCNPIDFYDNCKITLGTGFFNYSNDHIAIIPRDHFKSFFFDRMTLYRNNTNIYFDTPETVYWHTIQYNIGDIGSYFVKRK